MAQPGWYTRIASSATSSSSRSPRDFPCPGHSEGQQSGVIYSSVSCPNQVFMRSAEGVPRSVSVPVERSSRGEIQTSFVGDCVQPSFHGLPVDQQYSSVAPGILSRLLSSAPRLLRNPGDVSSPAAAVSRQDRSSPAKGLSVSSPQNLRVSPLLSPCLLPYLKEALNCVSVTNEGSSSSWAPAAGACGLARGAAEGGAPLPSALVSNECHSVPQQHLKFFGELAPVEAAAASQAARHHHLGHVRSDVHEYLQPSIAFGLSNDGDCTHHRSVGTSARTICTIPADPHGRRRGGYAVDARATRASVSVPWSVERGDTTGGNRPSFARYSSSVRFLQVGLSAPVGRSGSILPGLFHPAVAEGESLGSVSASTVAAWAKPLLESTVVSSHPLLASRSASWSSSLTANNKLYTNSYRLYQSTARAAAPLATLSSGGGCGCEKEGVDLASSALPPLYSSGGTAAQESAEVGLTGSRTPATERPSFACEAGGCPVAVQGRDARHEVSAVGVLAASHAGANFAKFPQQRKQKRTFGEISCVLDGDPRSEEVNHSLGVARVVEDDSHVVFDGEVEEGTDGLDEVGEVRQGQLSESETDQSEEECDGCEGASFGVVNTLPWQPTQRREGGQCHSGERILNFWSAEPLLGRTISGVATAFPCFSGNKTRYAVKPFWSASSCTLLRESFSGNDGARGCGVLCEADTVSTSRGHIDTRTVGSRGRRTGSEIKRHGGGLIEHTSLYRLTDGLGTARGLFGPASDLSPSAGRRTASILSHSLPVRELGTLLRSSVPPGRLRAPKGCSPSKVSIRDLSQLRPTRLAASGPRCVRPAGDCPVRHSAEFCLPARVYSIERSGPHCGRELDEGVRVARGFSLCMLSSPAVDQRVADDHCHQGGARKQESHLFFDSAVAVQRTTMVGGGSRNQPNGSSTSFNGGAANGSAVVRVIGSAGGGRHTHSGRGVSGGIRHQGTGGGCVASKTAVKRPGRKAGGFVTTAGRVSASSQVNACSGVVGELEVDGGENNAEGDDEASVLEIACGGDEGRAYDSGNGGDGGEIPLDGGDNPGDVHNCDTMNARRLLVPPSSKRQRVIRHYGEAVEQGSPTAGATAVSFLPHVLVQPHKNTVHVDNGNSVVDTHVRRNTGVDLSPLLPMDCGSSGGACTPQPPTRGHAFSACRGGGAMSGVANARVVSSGTSDGVGPAAVIGPPASSHCLALTARGARRNRSGSLCCASVVSPHHHSPAIKSLRGGGTNLSNFSGSQPPQQGMSESFWVQSFEVVGHRRAADEDEDEEKVCFVESPCSPGFPNPSFSHGGCALNSLPVSSSFWIGVPSGGEDTSGGGGDCSGSFACNSLFLSPNVSSRHHHPDAGTDRGAAGGTTCCPASFPVPTGSRISGAALPHPQLGTGGTGAGPWATRIMQVCLGTGGPGAQWGGSGGQAGLLCGNMSTDAHNQGNLENADNAASGIALGGLVASSSPSLNPVIVAQLPPRNTASPQGTGTGRLGLLVCGSSNALSSAPAHHSRSAGSSSSSSSSLTSAWLFPKEWLGRNGRLCRRRGLLRGCTRALRDVNLLAEDGLLTVDAPLMLTRPTPNGGDGRLLIPRHTITLRLQQPQNVVPQATQTQNCSACCCGHHHACCGNVCPCAKSLDTCGSSCCSSLSTASTTTRGSSASSCRSRTRGVRSGGGGGKGQLTAGGDSLLLSAIHRRNSSLQNTLSRREGPTVVDTENAMPPQLHGCRSRSGSRESSYESAQNHVAKDGGHAASGAQGDNLSRMPASGCGGGGGACLHPAPSPESNSVLIGWAGGTRGGGGGKAAGHCHDISLASTSRPRSCSSTRFTSASSSCGGGGMTGGGKGGDGNGGEGGVCLASADSVEQQQHQQHFILVRSKPAYLFLWRYGERVCTQNPRRRWFVVTPMFVRTKWFGRCFEFYSRFQQGQLEKCKMLVIDAISRVSPRREAVIQAWCLAGCLETTLKELGIDYQVREAKEGPWQGFPEPTLTDDDQVAEGVLRLVTDPADEVETPSSHSLLSDLSSCLGVASGSNGVLPGALLPGHSAHFSSATNTLLQHNGASLRGGPLQSGTGGAGSNTQQQLGLQRLDVGARGRAGGGTGALLAGNSGAECGGTRRGHELSQQAVQHHHASRETPVRAFTYRQQQQQRTAAAAVGG
ncbi:hypothetical protein CSUI_000050 [Cystoisospora suis]|uniref:Uncharacterized protein n=1 Tax=Cystoisospora suis TaxID=483139 RepID=A0A2C6LDM2_9APIC|nr:hypothetical protein CSUI_000050 [Cystoisospora suis]